MFILQLVVFSVEVSKYFNLWVLIVLIRSNRVWWGTRLSLKQEADVDVDMSFNSSHLIINQAQKLSIVFSFYFYSIMRIFMLEIA